MHHSDPSDAIELLYVDTLLVIDTPSGLLAMPGRGADKQDCLGARVQAPDALIVYRLDMATSGLMVMARGAATQRELSRAFAARAVKKRYIAVVAGRPEAPPEGWGHHRPAHHRRLAQPALVDRSASTRAR